MTEREIQLLGFKVQHDDGDGYFDKYRFYTYKVSNGLSFISNASDEIKEGGEWFVEVFNTEPVIRFTKFEEVQALINKLETHKIKQHE